MESKLTMDCYFDYEGEIVSARIKDDKTEIRTIHSVEKMSGFIDFYNKTGYYGTEAFYENFDDMTPIKPHIAKKYYYQLKERKNKY